MSNEKKERIVLDVAYQPQVRTNTDTRRIMLDVMIALLPAVAVAVWQFGIYPLLVIAVSMASAVFFEWGYRKLLKKHSTIGDLSACVTGILLALVLPPDAPWWLPIIGTFFAIVVVKQLYGGIGKNFLNPALAGRAFLLASYAAIMSGAYLVPKALRSTIDAATMATPLSFLYDTGAMPEYFSFVDLLIGKVPGCIGEISALALIIGGVYLVLRKVISWRIPVSFVGTVALLCLIFGYQGYGRVEWMLYNVLSGGLMLGAIFMATDYVTSPITHGGQIVYGIGCGVLTVAFRYFGSYPEGVTFAILIMNCCVGFFDKIGVPKRFGAVREKKKKGGEAA